MDAFQTARELANRYAQRVEERQQRRRLAEMLRAENRLGVQIQTGDGNVAHVLLCPKTFRRPRKQERVARLTELLRTEHEQISEAIGGPPDQLGRVAERMMGIIDRREPTEEADVYVRVGPAPAARPEA
jgi:hypothetical protein